MSISQGRDASLITPDQPERVEVLRTSSTLFALLGAAPLHGRLLLPEDDVPGNAPVAILSHNIWRRLFNGDPNVIGRTITLNGAATGPRENKNQFTIGQAARTRRRGPHRRLLPVFWSAAVCRLTDCIRTGGNGESDRRRDPRS